MPSLSMTWNTALRFVFASGLVQDDALVINNDVRLHPKTYGTLRLLIRDTNAYLVSGVGVHADQFHPDTIGPDSVINAAGDIMRGGPDFSCFCITNEGWTKYPFDERFPVYHEDNDLHRRMLLAGDSTKIFGANLPFLHYASQTINRSPEALAAFAPIFEASRQ